MKGVGISLLVMAALLAAIPIVVITTAGPVVDPRVWYGMVLLLVLLGARELAVDKQRRPRTMWRGLLLVLAGVVCFFLLGPNAWDAGGAAAIGLMGLGILFATIGLYQLVLGLVASQVHQVDG